MRYVVTILAVLLGVSFLGNYPVLHAIFPKHEVDYYVFLDFYKVRNIINSARDCTFFFALFLVTGKYPLAKAIFKFFFIMSFASFFDTVNGINHYLRSDILIGLIAFEISIFQYYFYDRKVR